MNKLIKLQIRNVFYSKFFYVCLVLSILMSPMMNFIFSKSLGASAATKVFPEITTFISSGLGIITIIFIALFSCFDFNEGTTKNIIARGYTRTQLLVSKYIVSLISIFTIYIITSLLIFVLYIKNGIGYDSSLIYPLIKDIVSIIAYTFLYSTMSYLLEKNGSAIIACLFVPNIIPGVLGIIDSKFKIDISKFWIDNVAYRFDHNPTLGNLGLSTLYYCIYIVAIIFIGTQLIKNKEIK